MAQDEAGIGEDDVIYTEPELNLWWKIKKIFSLQVFHPKGYKENKKEEKNV